MKVALKCFQSLVLEILPMPAHTDLYSPLDPIVETNALFAPESVTLETIMALFRSYVAISTLNSGALESTETRAFIFLPSSRNAGQPSRLQKWRPLFSA